MKHLLLLVSILSLASCQTLKNTVRPEHDSEAAPVDAQLSQLEYKRDKPFGAAYLAPTAEPTRTAAGKVLAKVFGGSGKQKVKNSTIIYQVGEGHTAAVPTKTEAAVQVGQGHRATDNREAGAGGGSAATAKGATASVRTSRSGLPWWVAAGFLLTGAAGGWWLRGQRWMPAQWRVA